VRPSTSPQVAIFVTVLIDMLSFGLVIPDIQIRAEELGASGLLIGLIISSFSIAQFIASPIVGRWSDRVGRKPILIAGAGMNVLSFVAYAAANSIPVFFLSRILGGLGSSNMSAAYAYVADNTEPDKRAKAMGLVGAAFGLGFVLGPPLGGLLTHIGNHVLLGAVAAAIALLNVLWIARFLPEKWALSEQHTAATASNLGMLWRALALPGLGVLLMMFFAYNLGFSNLESTFVLFTKRQFGFDQLAAGLYLGMVGVLIAIYQGLTVGPLVAKFGELPLARLGLLVVAPGLAVIPFAPTVLLLCLVSVFLCFGAAITTPTTQTLISRAAPPSIQGGVFGITQSLGALARIIGPLIGQSALDRALWLPYVIAGGLCLVAVLMAWTVVRPAPAAEPAGL
jgi:multidrug resistance protein